MKTYRGFCFILGILVGWQTSLFFSASILKNEVSFDVSNPDIQTQITREIHSSVLLSFVVHEKTEVEYLKEIYDPHSSGHVFFYRKDQASLSEIRPNDSHLDSLLGMLQHIHYHNLSSKFEYFALAKNEIYIDFQRLENYLRHQRSFSSKTMVSYFSNHKKNNVESDGEKLNNILTQPLVVVNRQLLKVILKAALLCMVSLPDTIWDCIERNTEINIKESNQMKRFTDDLCSDQERVTSLPWKNWCIKHLQLNSQVANHIYQQSSRIQEKQIQIQKYTKEIENFNFFLEKQDLFNKRNETVQFDTKKSWEFLSQSLKYTISERKVDQEQSPHVSKLLYLSNKIIFSKKSTNSRRNNAAIQAYYRLNNKYAEEYILQDPESLKAFYMKIGYSDLIVGEMNLPQSRQLKNMTQLMKSEKKIVDLKIPTSFKATGFAIGREELAGRIVLVVPYCCRLGTLARFLVNVQDLVTRTKENIHLVLVAFEDFQTQPETRKLVEDFFLANSSFPITLLQKVAPFQRGPACQLGSSVCSKSDLIFFVDVDMLITEETLCKVRWLTQQGSQVYYPIVYSRLKYQKYNGSWIEIKNTFEINEDTGFWRTYGFGMLGIFKSDFNIFPGFSQRIKGWGEEDVDLANKIVQLTNLSIHRSPDNSLIHLHHEKQCDVSELGKKYKSCIAVRHLHLASTNALTSYLQKHKDAFETTRSKVSKSIKKHKISRSHRKVNNKYLLVKRGLSIHQK